MAKTVSCVACSSYEMSEVKRSVRQALDLLGGPGSFVRPDMTVFVKPNLLAGVDPARSVTTHPEVVAAVARLLTGYGCRVIIGDSPGAGTRYTPASLKRIYRRCGIAPHGEIPGVILNDDISHTTIPSPDGQVVKRFLIIRPAVEADLIVSISKPKTHLLTTYTGAVKNLFGLVPGHEKSLFHSRFPDAEGFSRMLVDLTLAVPPVLHVMDAVWGMEGNGPMSGEPRYVGRILASWDPFALDLVACRAIGIPEDLVPVLSIARDRRLLTDDPLVPGDGFDPLENGPFLLPDTIRPAGLRMKITRKLLAHLQKSGRVFIPRPAVVSSACIRCGACVEICPVEAISLADGSAAIDRSLCIRCYCCHESCEAAAIAIARGLFPGITRRQRQ